MRLQGLNGRSPQRLATLFAFSRDPPPTCDLTNATLIYNPVAGRHPAKREREVREAAWILGSQGIAVRLAPTSATGTASELARRSVGQGDSLVLVCGGDGTINEVVNGLAPGNATLGILPGGTANLAARELGVPMNPLRAARQLSTWSPRRVALGVVSWSGAAPASAVKSESGRRYFLSVAGIGFDAYVIHKLSSDFKTSWGAASYIGEALRQTRRYSFPRFNCKVDDGQFQATFAVVHRLTRYGGWLRLAPGANLFGDEFRVCFFESRSRLRYFLYAAAVISRLHLRLKDVKLVEARKVACAAEDSAVPVYFELDGELVGQLPATFEVVPNALTLLVPPGAAS